MQRLAFFFLALILVVGGGVYYFNQKHVVDAPSTTSAIPTTTNQPTFKPTITSQPKISLDLYCTADVIDARITLEPAAGNVYGTLTLKNTGTKNCTIDGNKFIQPTSAAKNITITKEGTPGPAYITLQPDETIYSQVHYPNGPQCTSPTETKAITFAYRISPSQTVTFSDNQSNYDQSLTACSSDNEKTAIEVWSLTSSPIR